MNNNHLKKLSTKREIILGSGSPRRVSLLTEMGISFTQIIPDVEEYNIKNEKPFQYALDLAELKGGWVAKRIKPDQIAISCDTIVVLNNKVLGKPQDKENAFEILSQLSGQNHVVCTAVAFVDRNGILSSGFEITDVFFNHVTSEQIKAYIDSGEPMDKAGAYGIQGMGAFLVDRIKGNLDNVIGLPSQLLEELAEKITRILE
jgi:nucleoside triphosphate pyrophosphatase